MTIGPKVDGQALKGGEDMNIKQTTKEIEELLLVLKVNIRKVEDEELKQDMNYTIDSLRVLTNEMR